MNCYPWLPEWLYTAQEHSDIIALLSPSDKENDSFEDRVLIEVSKNLKLQYDSLDSYVHEYVQKLIKHPPKGVSFTLLESVPMIVTGQYSKQITYLSKDRNGVRKISVVFIIQNSILYTIFYADELEKYNKALPDFQRIVKSFEIA